MGWWDQGKNGEEVIIGDGPLDVAGDMLKRIARDYKRELGRKPTPTEIAKTLEVAINSTLEQLIVGGENKEVTSLTFALKDLPPKPKYVVGDHVAIPLEGGGYGYCRVTDIYGHGNLLLDILDVHSGSLLGPQELAGMDLVGEVFTDEDEIRDRVWVVVRSVGEPPARPKRTAAQRDAEANRQLVRLGGRSSMGIARYLAKLLAVRGRLPRR